jgi:hypothetical protein
MYRVDEHGQGRLGDGGGTIGDVLLTGVEQDFWFVDCDRRGLDLGQARLCGYGFR